MKFEIVIATYNRPGLLKLALQSVANAKLPDDMALRIIVADNNSKTENQIAYRAVVEQFSNLRIDYLFEARQGKSWALNTAIDHCVGDYVGFIDDDEKIDAEWLEVCAKHIRYGKFDYVGGPYKPDWAAKAPNWLPVHVGKYRAVLGWIEQSELPVSFDHFGGGLCGGNFICRRDALTELGGFSTSVGRSANNLMGGEDDELHRRLKAHGRTGLYDPALIIFHHIPASRMTRKYHLRWAFWSGASNGVRLNWLPPEQTPTVLGLPRYRFSQALKGIADFLGNLVPITPLSRPKSFTGLLDFVYFLGALYGRHFIAVEK